MGDGTMEALMALSSIPVLKTIVGFAGPCKGAEGTGETVAGRDGIADS